MFIYRETLARESGFRGVTSLFTPPSSPMDPRLTTACQSVVLCKFERLLNNRNAGFAIRTSGYGNPTLTLPSVQKWLMICDSTTGFSLLGCLSTGAEREERSCAVIKQQNCIKTHRHKWTGSHTRFLDFCLYF